MADPRFLRMCGGEGGEGGEGGVTFSQKTAALLLQREELLSFVTIITMLKIFG